jgi:hypothetical protein
MPLGDGSLLTGKLRGNGTRIENLRGVLKQLEKEKPESKLLRLMNEALEKGHVKPHQISRRKRFGNWFIRTFPFLVPKNREWVQKRLAEAQEQRHENREWKDFVEKHYASQRHNYAAQSRTPRSVSDGRRKTGEAEQASNPSVKADEEALLMEPVYGDSDGLLVDALQSKGGKAAEQALVSGTQQEEQWFNVDLSSDSDVDFDESHQLLGKDHAAPPQKDSGGVFGLADRVQARAERLFIDLNVEGGPIHIGDAVTAFEAGRRRKGIPENQQSIDHLLAVHRHKEENLTGIDGREMVPLAVRRNKDGKLEVIRNEIARTSERAIDKDTPHLFNVYVSFNEETGAVSIRCSAIDSREKAEQFLEVVKWAAKEYKSKLKGGKFPPIMLEQLNSHGLRIPFSKKRYLVPNEHELIRSQQDALRYLDTRIHKAFEEDDQLGKDLLDEFPIAHRNTAYNGFVSLPIGNENAISREETNPEGELRRLMWISDRFPQVLTKEGKDAVAEAKKALRSQRSYRNTIVEAQVKLRNQEQIIAELSPPIQKAPKKDRALLRLLEEKEKVMKARQHVDKCRADLDQVWQDGAKYEGDIPPGDRKNLEARHKSAVDALEAAKKALKKARKRQSKRIADYIPKYQKDVDTAYEELDRLQKSMRGHLRAIESEIVLEEVKGQELSPAEFVRQHPDATADQVKAYTVKYLTKQILRTQLGDKKALKLSNPQQVMLSLQLNHLLGVSTEKNCKSGLDRTQDVDAKDAALRLKVKERAEELAKGPPERDQDRALALAEAEVTDFVCHFQERVTAMRAAQFKRMAKKGSDFDYLEWLNTVGNEGYRELHQFQSCCVKQDILVGQPIQSRSTGAEGKHTHWGTRFDSRISNPLQPNPHIVSGIPYEVEVRLPGEEEPIKVQLLEIQSDGSVTLTRDGVLLLEGGAKFRKT